MRYIPFYPRALLDLSLSNAERKKIAKKGKWRLRIIGSLLICTGITLCATGVGAVAGGVVIYEGVATCGLSKRMAQMYAGVIEIDPKKILPC